MVNHLIVGFVRYRQVSLCHLTIPDEIQLHVDVKKVGF